jgi:hypothetical protein
MIINSPTFIKAKTPVSLRELMLELIVTTGLDIKFFDIQFSNGYWFAWYYQTQDTMTLLQKVTK